MLESFLNLGRFLKEKSNKVYSYIYSKFLKYYNSAKINH